MGPAGWEPACFAYGQGALSLASLYRLKLVVDAAVVSLASSDQGAFRQVVLLFARSRAVQLIGADVCSAAGIVGE